MAKIDDEKQAKIFWKKIIVFILMAVSWWFVSGKISELYYFIYKDEIVFKQDLMLASVDNIKSPDTNLPISIYLKAWYRDKDRILATQNFESNYTAESVLLYYRKELLENGWSDLVYKKNINYSTEKHLNDEYSAEKGGYIIKIFFENLLKNPENISAKFDGLQKSKSKIEYSIILIPVDKNKW